MYRNDKLIKQKIFMKNVIFIFLLIPSFLFSQEIGFDVNTNEGNIEIIYILDSNKVFKISETIDEVYIFSSDSLAKNYLQTLDQNRIPKNNYQLGETTIFLNSVSSIDYYTSDSPSGLSGQIKSINNLIFTYAADYSWNKNSGIVGELTQIGKTKITYWKAAGYAEKGKYRGKIKSLGNKQFKYEGWSSWGEKAGMVGKLISIGKIKINYYETDYDRGFKGKLKSIGAVKFIYFGETFNHKKANIVGKFKEQIGQDGRLIIH